MRFRKFGCSEIEVPVIGQGTWNLPSGGAAREAAIAAIRAGLDLGLLHLDTAEMYGDGKSEELLAEVIKGFPRDRLFLVSKVLPHNASYKGTIRACEASLARLQVDYLDCYLLHWQGSHPLEDTMRALEKLVADGKILHLGVSNFDLEDLKEAQSCLTGRRIACNQVLYNLHDRGIERKLLPYCRKESVAIVGYTPFGQRRLPSPGSREGKVMHEIAEKHGASVSQVILAFLVREDGMFVIPKAADVDHVRQNAAAGDLMLDKEDIDRIDRLYPAPDRDVPLGVI